MVAKQPVARTMTPCELCVLPSNVSTVIREHQARALWDATLQRCTSAQVRLYALATVDVLQRAAQEMFQAEQMLCIDRTETSRASWGCETGRLGAGQAMKAARLPGEGAQKCTAKQGALQGTAKQGAVCCGRW